METTNIWFVAFLKMKGEKISNFKKNGNNKSVFFFEMSNEKWTTFKLDFNNSEFTKFKNCVEDIRDLIN